VFPELAPLARAAVRLHPRAGTPTAHDSSVGGPLLWPADQEWPTCSGDPDLHPGCTSRLVPVAQLYHRDVPGLPAPAGTDLLQVLWCPNDGDEGLPLTRLVWRDSGQVAEALAVMPPPDPDAEQLYLPKACVVDPETVVEYPAALELDKPLRDRITEWAEREGHEPVPDHDRYHWSSYYSDDLSVAPGWKAGGWGHWGVTDPETFRCATCDAVMLPLLTIDSSEHYASWIPEEDRQAIAEHGDDVLEHPTGVEIGRGYSLQLYTCPMTSEHGHVQNMQ
jgi:hypothetical protein